MHLPESSPRDCSGMRLAVHDALFDASLASSMMNAHGVQISGCGAPRRACYATSRRHPGERWGGHGDDMLSFAQPRAVESLVETTHLPPPEHQKRVASAVVNVSKFCECCFLTI